MQISIDQANEIARDVRSYVTENCLDHHNLELIEALATVHVLSRFGVEVRLRANDALFHDAKTYEHEGSKDVFAFSLSDDIPRDMNGNEGWGAILVHAINNDRDWMDVPWNMGEWDDESALINNAISSATYDVKSVAESVGSKVAPAWEARLLSIYTPGVSGSRSLRL